MTTRPTLASVVIPNQHQQMTTQQEQTQTHSSQPPIFSKPPFTTTIAPRSTSSQYDPQNNWQVSRKRTYELPNQSSHADKIKKLSNINDLITNEERKDTKKCLVVQKSRENEFNPENPRFVTNLRYALKTEFNSFRVADKVKIQNTATGEEFFAKSRELPIIPDFSLHDNLNVWRIKDRSDEQRTYLVRNNQLDVYANVPYSAITAFPTPSDHIGEISKESLISENSKFRQELFIKKTELQEVTIKLEQFRVKLDKQEKETCGDYWRRQYIISKQLDKTEESNLKTLNQAYARKHLEVTSANQKLGAENKKLIEQNKQLSAQLDKQKKKNRKQKKIIKELSKTEKDEKGNEVVEVFDIMDDGNSPVPSPVILPPEF